MTFGERLLMMRTARGWSLRALERVSGVPLSTLQRLEKKTPQHGLKIETLTRLADAYDVTIDSLFGRHVLPADEEAC